MMSLLTRRKTILAKVESVYGTDPTPDGTANAMLVKNLEVQPLNAEVLQRDLIRDYLGNSDTLIASRFSTATFEVELAGAGAAGAAPAYGPLLKACGFAQSLNTQAITSIDRVSTTATVTTTLAHGLATGAVVKISGATESEYNKNATITVTGASTFTYTVTGAPSTPASGTPVLGVSASYAPVSTSFDSVTIYYNVDGVLHKLTGCRGSFEINLAVKTIPTLKFSFTGIYNDPTDTSSPTTDFTGFQIPKVANTTNTPSFSLFSYGGYMESMALNLSNEVNYRTLIGYEEIKIVDRKPSGTFLIEAPTIAAKDFFTLGNTGTTGAMALTHGLVGGNKVLLAAPRVSIGNPQYQDSQGVQMLSIPFTISPSSGNDELVITVK
jgi:hypothetical protein